eukprot:TRINITY_DN9182_c0_g1_i1.p1 TRINITY_DN9182_c0_g1~~TRINITY_DN9182_c0_g1_i1.p1  ORF type:complete len:183 (+),score=45.66 TRINITY_DN9182_c0_g1_i1:90-638(+)
MFSVVFFLSLVGIVAGEEAAAQTCKDPKKELQLIEGGGCLGGPCYAWRHAECDGRFCTCQPGTCDMGGECVKPDDCPKNTGGTCNVLECKPERGATCLKTPGRWLTGKQCVCAEDECAVGGKCVKKNSAEMSLAAETQIDSLDASDSFVIIAASVAGMAMVAAALLKLQRRNAPQDYVTLAA